MSVQKLSVTQPSTEQTAQVAVRVTSSRPNVDARPREQTEPIPEKPRPTDRFQQRWNLDSLADQMSSMSNLLQKDYDFSVDEETGQFIVRVSDPESGDILRQVPPEEMLELARQLGQMIGVFLNEIA